MSGTQGHSAPISNSVTSVKALAKRSTMSCILQAALLAEGVRNAAPQPRTTAGNANRTSNIAMKAFSGVLTPSPACVTLGDAHDVSWCKTWESSVDNGSICYRSYLAHYKVGLWGEVMGSGQLTNLPCFSAPALS